MNEHNEEFQKGNESKLSSTERLFLHQEWLQKQHEDIKKNIYNKNKEQQPAVVGFIRD